MEVFQSANRHGRKEIENQKDGIRVKSQKFIFNFI